MHCLLAGQVGIACVRVVLGSAVRLRVRAGPPVLVNREDAVSGLQTFAVTAKCQLAPSARGTSRPPPLRPLQAVQHQGQGAVCLGRWADPHCHAPDCQQAWPTHPPTQVTHPTRSTQNRYKYMCCGPLFLHLCRPIDEGSGKEQQQQSVVSGACSEWAAMGSSSCDAPRACSQPPISLAALHITWLKAM